MKTIEKIIGITAVTIFVIFVGLFLGVSIENYRSSKYIATIIDKKQIAEQGKIIRWGFFPESSIVEMRFSNNTEISCIKKDNVIRIIPMANSAFCELRLLSKNGL